MIIQKKKFQVKSILQPVHKPAERTEYTNEIGIPQGPAIRGYGINASEVS